MEETISISDLFQIIKKRIGLIVISLLLGIALAAGVTFFLIKPQYSSSAELIVQSKSSKDQNMNLQANVNANVLLINTYKDMIMGDVVMNTAQHNLVKKDNLKVTKGELKNIVSVEQSQNSQMFQIVTKTNNPDKAAKITNEVAKVFKEKAKDVLDVNRVTITSKGQSNPDPVSPNNKINIAIGAIVGLFVGFGLAIMFELFDKSVKDQNFVTEEMDLPILGVVREMSSKEVETGRSFTAARINDVKPVAKSTDTSSNKRTRDRV